MLCKGCGKVVVNETAQEPLKFTGTFTSGFYSDGAEI